MCGVWGTHVIIVVSYSDLLGLNLLLNLLKLRLQRRNLGLQRGKGRREAMGQGRAARVMTQG